MRIGVNTLFLVPSDVGGTEIYLRHNLKEMVIARSSESFVLFTSRDNEHIFRADLENFSNIEYVTLPFKAANRPFRIIIEQILLPKYVRESGVDVLWSPGYTAPIRCSCPQAVTIHDLQYKTHPEDLTFLERKTLDFLVSSACRVCDSIIGVSEFSRQEILRYGFAPQEKVFAILEGVDPALALSPAPGTVNPVSQYTSQPYILCVAHTYPHKNVHVLVDAFSQIAGAIPHDLVLLGKARKGEERLQRSLEGMQCKGRVHRLTSIDFSQLTSVYQKADLFVLPSEYEGFGLPILEAMLCGVPVITTNKASLPEVGGPHARYVGECSAKIISSVILDVIRMDGKEREAKVQSARSWASSFSWQRSAEKTFRVLENISRENPSCSSS